MLYFISFFKDYYQKNDSLENAFYAEDEFGCCSVEKGLVQFHELFFGLPDFPTRTKKHISTPLKKSTCKRLNMFLRWMVRADENQVDFGIWKRIPMSELYIPFDVHVERFARKLQLIKREKKD